MAIRQILAVLLTVFLTVPLHVSAQANPGVLTVTGLGQVTVTPDTATISLGVEVEAPTADRALRLNSARMIEIFKVLQENSIDKRDVQTSQLSLHPLRSNRSSSGNQPLKVTGYLATNLVEVKIRELDKLGAALDALSNSGANRIQNIRFGISQPAPHLDQARALATVEAMRKAALFAQAAQMNLGSIISLTEGARAAAPQFRTEAFADSLSPIAEGELTLNATVTIQYSLITP